MIIYFNFNKIEYLYNSILLYKHSKQQAFNQEENESPPRLDHGCIQ